MQEIYPNISGVLGKKQQVLMEDIHSGNGCYEMLLK